MSAPRPRRPAGREKHGEVPSTERYRPPADDGCPLFSASLEDHLVARSRGEEPASGRFCGHCYTPLTRDARTCRHCGTDPDTGRPPVDRVPDEVMDILIAQRKTESTWVNGLAYLGLLIAIVGGISLVLAIPFFRERLIWATVVYAIILIVGGRVLAGLLGGYLGDRLGYERARTRTLEAWAWWVQVRNETGDRL